MVTIQNAIECFGDELPNMTATEKDYLQAVRSYNTTESDAEILVKFRERINKLFGNETLSESDALMMLTARETGEIQTAYEGEDMVVYAPNEAPKRVSKGEITIEEIYDMITDYK